MRPIHTLLTTVAGLALAAIGVHPADAGTPTDLPAVVQEMAAELGFGSAEIERLLDGDIVPTTLTEGSQKELALAVAMLVPLSPAQIYRELEKGQFFAISRTILDQGDLPLGGISASDLSGLEIPPSELAKLREARPGSTFNLSTAEIAALRATSDDATTAETYRSLLAARAAAYLNGGVPALAPYDRGRGRAAYPGEDLRTSVLALAHLENRSPRFFRFLRDFPKHPAPELHQRMLWSTQDIQDRPTAVLSHWVLGLHPSYALTTERQFYVAQSYNALQVAGGAFALDATRSLVFYTNRTATDQITGFAGSAARGIARRIMLGKIVEFFEAIRSAIENGALPDRSR